MYQVIARKYRPQNFDELIGQEHVQKTLANAIQSHRIAHGYIFSGQRGTGKTTVARILARCLNCIQGTTPSPCGVCASCLEITAGNSTDVIEIDAASNRGINEMREIRENVRYRPSRDRYKIFIVDEAHQITKEAFNALLKTLEEPPEWVVFILCTTEAAEIPVTIASRCQHFNFRSVDFAQVVERMRFIVQQEGISATDEVLSVVARAGEGSVRDSLSALDQAIACCGAVLVVEDVRALLGMFGAASLNAVATAVSAQDGGAMLDIVQELERNGQSLQHFCRELSRYWRNLLVAKIAGKITTLIPASDQEQQALLDTAAGFSEEDLTRYLNLTLDLYKTMQYSLQPRMHLELGLIKLVQAGRLQSIEEALSGMGGATQSAPPPPRKIVPPAKSAENPLLSQSAKPGTRSQFPPHNPAPNNLPPVAETWVRVPAVSPTDSPLSDPVSTSEPPPVAAKPASGDLRGDLCLALREAKLDFSADAMLHATVELQGSDLVIRASKMRLLSLKDPNVAAIAAKLLGRPVRVKTEVDETVVAAPVTTATAAANGPTSSGELRDRALSHPGVKRFQELFPDAQVRTVRNLSE